MGLLDLDPFDRAYLGILASGSCSVALLVSGKKAHKEIGRWIGILILRLRVDVGKAESGLRVVRSVDRRSQNGDLQRLPRRCCILRRQSTRPSGCEEMTSVVRSIGRGASSGQSSR